MKIHIKLVIITAIIISIFTGCGTVGPLYPNVKASLKPQPGKGLVIFYYKRAGGPNKWHIYGNGKLLTDKFMGLSFFTYQADPGDLKIYSTHNMYAVPVALDAQLIGLSPSEAPTIHVEANHIYYMDFHGVFPKINNVFGLVPNEEGEQKIKNCEWINPS